jgi:lysophospholipase L1-like esterase
MKIPRKYLARAIVVLLAMIPVALLLVGVEFACRAIFSRIDPRAVFVSDPGEVPADNPTMFDYKRFWKLRAGMKDRYFVGTTVTTNSLGIRWDKEFEKKEPHTIRILPMGDSVTFGWGVAKDPANNVGNYSYHLQRILNERHPDWKWEVIPLACPGYTTPQGRFWLEDTIDKIQPDIIIPCYAWNDASDSMRTNNQVGMYSKSAQRIRWMAEHSQAITRFLNWRTGSGKPIYSDSVREGREWLRLPRTTLEDYIIDHEAMWKLAKKHGAETSVILPMITILDEKAPFTNECITLFRNKLAEFCKDREIPALLIPELTEKAAPENYALFTPDKIHPNADGHKLIGERLYPFLIPQIDYVTAKRREANAVAAK